MLNCIYFWTLNVYGTVQRSLNVISFSSLQSQNQLHSMSTLCLVSSDMTKYEAMRVSTCKQGFRNHVEPSDSEHTKPYQPRTGMVQSWKMVRDPELSKNIWIGPVWYGTVPVHFVRFSSIWIRFGLVQVRLESDNVAMGEKNFFSLSPRLIYIPLRYRIVPIANRYGFRYRFSDPCLQVCIKHFCFRVI